MQDQSQHRGQPLVFRTLREQLVAVRQVTAADALLLAKLLSQLSKRTLYLRYMSGRHFTPDVIWNEVTRMACGQSPDHTTLVATIRSNQYDEAVAVAELVRDRHDRAVGEIALVVRGDVQRQGIGSFLLEHLVHVAQGGGITRLSANMLAENRAMLHLIRTLRLPYTATSSHGEMQILVSLPGIIEQLALERSTHKLAA
jgi:GNAT superfamily N-acetyltransferase